MQYTVINSLLHHIAHCCRPSTDPFLVFALLPQFHFLHAFDLIETNSKIFVLQMAMI
jgi:hypothetical protein